MPFHSPVSLAVRAGAAATLCLAALNAAAAAAPPYHPITPRLSDRTIVLTGRDLTIDQVVQVARDGAKVALSPEARHLHHQVDGQVPARQNDGSVRQPRGDR